MAEIDADILKLFTDNMVSMSNQLSKITERLDKNPPERNADQGPKLGASQQQFGQEQTLRSPGGEKDIGDVAAVTEENGKEGFEENAQLGRGKTEINKPAENKYKSINYENNSTVRPRVLKSGYEQQSGPDGYQIIKAALNGWGVEGIDARR